MSRFIFLSFAFLGWAFYEVSGGPDFQPRISAVIAATQNTSPTSSTIGVEQAAIRLRENKTETSETGLIVTRMAIADETVPGRGITNYTMSATDVPNDRKLVFSLSTAEPSPEIRRIRADNVNMRTGPGTEFVVVDNLAVDTRVKLLDGSVRGWVKLRSLDSGRVGWVKRRFLSAFTS
ncbi:SH3 domain-containing protein [Cognatishimia activa]|uniref:SH3 domain-containing protein n=1 Tax=Cognatishimia activa TaxID=1715691 RepID=A0A975I693_9RHOB|nr:SH3 domain-containing protein [Cognatishimia activa]QTN34659.1 SH3 domain-containing protein [Cognatishimia activa]